VADRGAGEMSEEQCATLRHIDLVLTIFLCLYAAMCGHKVTRWWLELKGRDPWPRRSQPGVVTLETWENASQGPRRPKNPCS
jgi:hypothetical protein